MLRYYSQLQNSKLLYRQTGDKGDGFQILLARIFLPHLGLEIFQCVQGFGAKKQNSYNGNPGHESHADVSQHPNQIGLTDGAEQDGGHKNGL